MLTLATQIHVLTQGWTPVVSHQTARGKGQRRSRQVIER